MVVLSVIASSKQTQLDDGLPGQPGRSHALTA